MNGPEHDTRPSGRYSAVVMGASAGGMEALAAILGGLSRDFPLPVLVVQHLHSSDGGGFARHMADATSLVVVEPHDKEQIVPGRVYIAPANYHMLVERNGVIALSIDERVNWSRPSIDVLFESAAIAWGARLIAVILSGSNHDGAEGMKMVRALGGTVIAQDPSGAAHPVMPEAAIRSAQIVTVLQPAGIAELLGRLGSDREGGAG